MKIKLRTLIVMIILAVFGILGWASYFVKSKQSDDYKERIAELDLQIEQKDVAIRQIQVERDLLKLERDSSEMIIAFLTSERERLDSIRKNIRDEDTQIHNDIDNADLVEVSSIITGLLEDTGN